MATEVYAKKDVTAIFDGIKSIQVTVVQLKSKGFDHVTQADLVDLDSRLKSIVAAIDKL